MAVRVLPAFAVPIAKEDCISSIDPCSEDQLRLRPFAVATLIALVAAGLTVQAFGADREPRIRAVPPKADAFVSEASKRQNFGHARNLKVASSPTLRTYITFKVDLSSDNVERVSLMLYSRTPSQVGYRVRLVGERWRERRITFANAPALSAPFVISGPLRAKAWKVVDVTSLAAGEEDYVGFVLTSASKKGAAFASRETGLRGPRLVVELQPDETTTRTTTTSTMELPVVP